ncbi:type I polyketide synthase, partial [Bacillus thuringiensis]|uniref:type I polyketide synthase n=1 Tax=Bacillus thuringiensis TaxID=1428 RepID=UPI00137AE0C8
MEQIKKFILEQTAKNNVTVPEARKLLLEIQQNSEQGENDIAVIGISCKFTDCEDQYEYWDKLFNGESCFVPYTEERSNYYRTVFDNPHYAEFLGTTILSGDENEEKARHKAGFLSDIDKFDAAFFNIPPREAKFMDPSQRLFLQTAWSAIEDAGYGGKKIVGTNTGVFVGRDGTSSTFYKFITESDPMHLTGTWEGILASRINYIFNLRGPSMVIDTACSSGLVSIHAACQSLRNKECDYAIAGGISLGTSAVAEDEDGKGDALTSVASNDNLVRTFDRKSTGTVFGEGVTAVLLKPLNKAIADKDSIYAVIKGSAINNDGASNGITAPNPAAQEDVIVKAWEQARINPETISYIEAHGTGTLLGDPIEIKGLTGAFRKYTDKKQFCGIGSVKTNMGHLVGASGIAGALKVILSLKEKKLPASLNFDEPNPHINFCESPLYVIDKLRDWKSNEAPRRAGISSFGFSGTNCHIVLEEAPQMVQETESNDNRDYILTLSGKSKSSLQELIKKYYKFVERREQNNLGNICYTANTGRGHYDYRLVLKLKDFEDFKQKITLLQEKGLEQEQDHGIYY